jgi:hypothetical protein
VTGNEVPNRPSVADTASGIERNNAQDRHQERKTGTCEEPPDPVPMRRAVLLLPQHDFGLDDIQRLVAHRAGLLTERAGLVDEKAVKVQGRTVIVSSPAIQASAPP